MSYLGELPRNWRSLLSASLGMAAGYNLSLYNVGLFTPYLLREFRWSMAQFSLVGSAVLVTVIGAPISGRLVDRFGPRRMAGVGVICAPLIFMAFSLMGPSFPVFMAINIVQVALVGLLTTSVVYSKLIAERFTAMRGISLAVMASSPALVGGLCAPALTRLIESAGWRAGYRGVALFVAIAGAAAIALMPRDPVPHADLDARAVAVALARPDYREIAATSSFRVIMLGMFLCNLALVTTPSFLKVLLQQRGLGSMAAVSMMSIFAFAIVAGRLAVGIALDRLPVAPVVAIAMALPGLALLILASGSQSPGLLALSCAMLGLSIGADSDVAGFVVMRHFPVGIYSSVIGLVGSTIALAGALGALLLSAVLAVTGGSFQPFLVLTGMAALLGGALFLLLGPPLPAMSGPRRLDEAS